MTYTPEARIAARRQRLLDFLARQTESVNTKTLRARFASTEVHDLKAILAQLVEDGTIRRTEYQPPRGRGGYMYELTEKKASAR